MAQFVDVPLANYPSGSISSPFRSIPVDATSISVAVQRCTSADTSIWPNATTLLDLTIDLSMDGGATVFNSATSGQIPGGILPGLHNIGEAQVSRIAMQGIPAGSNRAVRLSGAITNGPLRTSGTIEIT